MTGIASSVSGNSVSASLKADVHFVIHDNGGEIDLYGGETKAHFRFASGSPLKNFFLLNQIFKELTPVGGKLWMFPQVKMMM